MIEDQVWSLQKLGVPAELFSTLTGKSKCNYILKQLTDRRAPCKLNVINGKVQSFLNEFTSDWNELTMNQLTNIC